MGALTEYGASSVPAPAAKGADGEEDAAGMKSRRLCGEPSVSSACRRRARALSLPVEAARPPKGTGRAQLPAHPSARLAAILPPRAASLKCRGRGGWLREPGRTEELRRRCGQRKGERPAADEAANLSS